jgi:hypothetical protein
MKTEHMHDILKNTYEANSNLLRSCSSESDTTLESKIQIPVLSGEVGIGKTACVKEFAAKSGFILVRMDCTYEPANSFAARILMAVDKIENGSEEFLILIDNINQAPAGWRTILKQYEKGQLDLTIELFSPDTHSVQSTLTRACRVPVGLYIVGESRPAFS